MKKRVISLLLAIVMLIGVLPVGALSAFAADFETQMKNKGFPVSYIPYLSELHKKYPNWNFEALDTKESFSDAVAQERTPHQQQVIQMTASNEARDFYCRCSSCYKNGSYVIREGKNWVAASEKAVAYYMDPLESLDEKYIFQFETIFSKASVSQTGVEAILSGTWMHNANITYKDVNGKTVNYSPATKYSQAIMDAAKASGISAYYLASKIVQEVGGKNPTAGGASGTYSGYEGIYNYYNIGANTGAKDGLDWASTTSSDYKTNCNANLRSQATTDSTTLVTIPKSTKVTYLGTTSKQPDGYKWYNVRATVSGTTYTGYVRSDLIDGGTADKYNRPWTNPYISIYNGAVWIANNFKNQYSGYLQKFNVNPASSNMHGHEYMANVQAASSEAVKTYKAYESAGLLSAAKTFVIPVFSNMISYDVTNVKATEIGANSVRISYDKNPYVSGYTIQYRKYGSTEWKHLANTGYWDKVWGGFEPETDYEIRVCTHQKTVDGLVYSPNWSNTVRFKTKSDKIQNVKITEIGTNSARISCTKNPDVSGYTIQYRQKGSSEWQHLANTGYWDKVWEGFVDGTSYEVRMATHTKTDSGIICSQNWSETVSFTTKPVKVQNIKITDITSNTARISFDKIPSVSGYTIQLRKQGETEWQHLANTGYWDKVWEGFAANEDYEIRVSTHIKTSSGLVYSPTWSDIVAFSTKTDKVQNIKITEIAANSARISYNRIPEVSGYTIQLRKQGETEWQHLANTGYWDKVWGGFEADTDYEIRVGTHMKTASGLVYSPNWSDTIRFSTKTDAVQNVKITEIGTNSARISYDKNPNVSGYTIQYREAGGEWKHLANTGYWDKVWEGFVDGTNYEIRVSTHQKTADGIVYSNKWSNTVSLTTKPVKVQNVKLTNATSNSVRISFDKIPSVSGYTIQYRKQGSTEWKHLVNTGYYDKEWSGFDADTAYEIRVSTHIKTSSGLVYSPTWSDTCTFTTKSNKVQNVWVSRTGSDWAEISYSKIPEASGYTIQYRKQGDAEWKHLANTGYWDKVWGGFEPDTMYEIRVCTHMKTADGIVYSENWSDIQQFQTKQPKVTGLTAYYVEDGDPSQLLFEWDKVDSAWGYNFCVREAGSSDINDFECVYTATTRDETACVIYGLEPGVYYEFAVNAFKEEFSNHGDFSDSFYYYYD